MSATTSFYEKNALLLAEQYDSIDFEVVHRAWSAYWPKPETTVLDIGAGSGRDARWFHGRGCSVIAVEPSKELRQIGKQNSSQQIAWLGDTLPHLEQVACLLQQYDLVMLSAVWMHLPVTQRPIAIKTLSGLLSDDGILVITLRHGEFKDGRETFGASVTELQKLCNDIGLGICHIAAGEDSLSRTDVNWQTVVIKKIAGLER